MGGPGAIIHAPDGFVLPCNSRVLAHRTWRSVDRIRLQFEPPVEFRDNRPGATGGI